MTASLSTVKGKLQAAIDEVTAALSPPPPPPPPTSSARFPDRDLVLAPLEQCFSDDVDPGLYAPGATSKYLQQKRGATDEPGMYHAGGNAPVRWERIMGDWFDANGTKWGDQPIASAVLGTTPKNSERWVEIDVTSLVQAWARGDYPNWGFYLKAHTNNTVLIRSRFADANKPELVVDGATLPAGRNIELNGGQYTSLAGAKQFSLRGSAQVGLLWFDLSMLTTVTKATLRLSVGSWPIPPSTGVYDLPGNTIDVYRISNPMYAQPLPPVEMGLASKYPWHQGILADPAVLSYQDCSPDFEKKWMGGLGPQPAPTATRVDRIDDSSQNFHGRFPFIRCTLRANSQQSALERHQALWRGYGNQKPLLSAPPEELYMQYMRRYGDGRFGEPPWNQRPDGGKHPGFNMRFCDLTGSYVSAITPVVALTLDGSGRGNSGSGADGGTGASARGNADREPTPGSPLANTRGFAYGDCYNVDQTGAYGNDQFFSPWARARLGEVDTVELYLRMNDVTDPTQVPRRILSITQFGGVATVILAKPETDPKYQTGALWTVGGIGLYAGYQPTQYQGAKLINVLNATTFTFSCDPATPSPAVPGVGPTHPVAMWCAPSQGVPNGILRAWINGRRYCDRTDLRFRHTRYLPDGTVFGIDTAWWCVFEGGGVIPSKDASMDLGEMIVSTQYIGPMVTA